jgi:predicted enzyme related to lactoylglutathione lyase
MKIKVTSVFVDDQEKALRFYTEVLGFAKKQAIYQQSQPAAMFFTDDVQADYERMKAQGAEFTLPPKDVTGSKIAMLNDTCGNIIQVTQLMKW